MRDRSGLRDTLAAEHDRYTRKARETPQLVTETDLDQLFDLAVAVSYIDDDNPIPERVLARLVQRFIRGQVTASPADLREPEHRAD